MYNLSHAYIYEFQDEKLINKSIELLIKSSNMGFKPSTELLCLIILKKLKIKQKTEKKNNEKANLLIKNEKEKINIEKELSKFTKETRKLSFSINIIIQEQQLYDRSNFENYYKKYEEIEFVYDLISNPVCIKDLYNDENEKKLDNSKEKYNITSDFYERFGL